MDEPIEFTDFTEALSIPDEVLQKEWNDLPYEQVSVEQAIANLETDIRMLRNSRLNDIQKLLYFIIGISPADLKGKSYHELYYMLQDEILKLQGKEPRGNVLTLDEVLICVGMPEAINS